MINLLVILFEGGDGMSDYKYRVLYQVIDVESNKVLRYGIERKGVTYEIPVNTLLNDIKLNLVENCYFFNGLLVFKLNSINTEYFIRYTYSERLKEKLKNEYKKWEDYIQRQQFLDVEEYKLKLREQNCLYVLDSFKVLSEDLNEITIPSFVSLISQDTKEFYKTKMVSGNFNIEEVKNKLNTITVYIDKYTDGLFEDILSYDFKKICLYGLINVLPEKSIVSNNLNNSLNETDIEIFGKTKIVESGSLDSINNQLNICLGSNVRVFNIPSRTKELKCSDTTILLNKDDRVKVVLYKSNKPKLLDFKNYVERMADKLNMTELGINGYVLTLKFIDNEVMNYFISHLGDEYSYNITSENNVSLVKRVVSTNYGTLESLYWSISVLIQKMRKDLYNQYAFATLI